MPSGKPSEKTWNAEELGEALKEPREERRKHREKEEKRRPRDEDGERRRKRREDEDGRKKRDHETGDSEKKKHRSSRPHHDEDDEKKSRRRRDDGEEQERHRRHKDRDEDRERQHKDRDEDDGKHRSERKHREKDSERKEKRRPHKEDETEEERKIRKEREREERRKGRNEDEKRHRKDETEEQRRRRKDKEREVRKQEEEEEERKKKDEKKEKRRKEKEEKRKQEELVLSKKKPKEDEYNYDDDFEDYEDDFEEAEEEAPPQHKTKFNDEMEEILQAMNDENERLVKESKRGNWSDSSESEDMRSEKRRPTTASQRTFINFVSAKQRQISSKAASKTRLRGNELAQLIELDCVEFDMFDLPPIGEYELYIRNFGSSNTKQAYIQTNDDNLEREIQTEEVLFEEKWTQHPSEDIFSSGGDTEHKEDPELKVVDSIRLAKFLDKAGQVMAVLLEENFAETHKSDVSQQQSQICVSEAFNELTSPSYLEGRHVIQSQFSSSQNQALITVHSAKQGGEMNDPLAKKGIVCVWNVNEPSQPQSLLVCESQPTCGCLSPNKVSMAFAGMKDGSLVCWDLREVSSMHRSVKVKGQECMPHHPSYSTAGVLHYDNHQSAVVSVVTVSSGDGSGNTGSEGLSFQLATLEENSVIFLWVVAEMSHPDLSGSESDLGLTPGSRVKLIKSSSIVLTSPLRDSSLRTTVKSLDLHLLPSNNSHFYVATDTGCVMHGVRYGGRAPPKAYRTELEEVIDVTSIDFSPFSEPVFLAGFQDGSLRLFHVDCGADLPLVTWTHSTEGRAVQMVKWCRSRPAVFFVLDDRSTFHIWDLRMDDACPIHSENIAQTKVTSLSLSNDFSATGMGTSGRKPQMAVSLENGCVEVHTIKQQFSALMSEEVDEFSLFLQKNA